jgi:Uma2 family endonuclease
MIQSTETITRRRFTVDEYHRMWDIDLFPEDKRFELIRGDILEMPDGRPQHSARVNRLTHLFTRRLGDSIIVSVQNPFAIDAYSEPVPDVSILKPRGDFYAKGHPLPEDVLLLIEISQTTLRFDTWIKGPLYAEAGIAEYWIINLVEDALEVRSEPVNGRYSRHDVLKRGDKVTPRAFPGISFRVEEL